jgi:hypothetical protein
MLLTPFVKGFSHFQQCAFSMQDSLKECPSGPSFGPLGLYRTNYGRTGLRDSEGLRLRLHVGRCCSCRENHWRPQGESLATCSREQTGSVLSVAFRECRVLL